MPLSADELFMKRALALASEGVGLASPNPCVGAVIVDERGRIVGSGTHTYDGKKHAEVLAIEEAGDQARGNTLYLNLEPCSHTGRTGPCAQAVIQAGIARVVCAMVDPNPAVAGKGFHMLREAGVEVEIGLYEAEARRLNRSFAKYIRTGVPLVTLKAAMSLDGKIAPSPSAHAASNGPSYITGEAARERVHKMRHQSDAILVGVGTVLADDPLLTDRSGLPRRRPLLRVILDSRLRIPLKSRVVETADRDVLVLCSFAEEHKRRALEDCGVLVEQVSIATREPGHEESPHDGRPSLPQVFACLGVRQITSVLVEGGALVNWACLRSKVVDNLALFYTPRILGPAAVPWLDAGSSAIAEFDMHLREFEIQRVGHDVLMEATIRDPYGPMVVPL